MVKRAVILFNLGGPDGPKAVKPFLFNLFADKNIIPLPKLFRLPLAFLISSLRHKKAQKIYARMGGRSPILPETARQAAALENRLAAEKPEDTHKVFCVMRYWNPRLEDILPSLKEFSPDEIILLPLYPQFSTTTSRSSFEEWDALAEKHFKEKSVSRICCYPENKDFIQAHVDLTVKIIREKAKADVAYEILFSAHGIPKSCVDKGDPYQEQVEETVKAVEAGLRREGVTYPVTITYQSKVGPAEWLKPATETVIEELSAAKKGIIVSPIAFVSEHSETLVELDEDYAELASEKGAPSYIRVPALGTEENYIKALAYMTLTAAAGKGTGKSCGTARSACYKKACKNSSERPCALRG